MPATLRKIGLLMTVYCGLFACDDDLLSNINHNSGNHKGNKDSDSSGNKPTCEHDNQEYEIGSMIEVPCSFCDNYCLCDDNNGDVNAAWACTDCECSQKCEYMGNTYNPGETFSAGDGCNECTCELEDLGFGYTEAVRHCTTDECPPLTCTHGGRTYTENETVTVSCDNCDNECVCHPNGQGLEGGWSCTDCQCTNVCQFGADLYELGERFPSSDGCNECTCERNGIGMPTISCTKDDCDL